jgi:hypothetical protein
LDIRFQIEDVITTCVSWHNIGHNQTFVVSALEI